MSDFRVPIAAVMASFGVPATVTRPFPDDIPVVTTAAWVPPPLAETRPYGTDLQRLDPRKVLSLSRDANLPTLPRQTVIVAPEQAEGPVKTWRVDEIDRASDVDEWRVIVVRTN